MLKRIFSLLAVLALAAAMTAPVLAEDAVSGGDGSSGGGSSGSVTDPAPANTDGVYVVGYTVTDIAGGEITTVDVGDHVNVVLQVVDHSSARYNVKAEEISARINSSVFQYTGIGEIGQLFQSNDDPDQTRLSRVRNGEASEEEKAANAYYNYYSYVLLFRDVIYQGGGNTLPINLTYLDTSKPMQQFSVQIGQCMDKDQTTSPNLLVRSSSYGDSVVAGEEFTLSLGVYATAGNEPLSDVIVSLTLPENVSLSNGSLSFYLGSLQPETMQTVSFPVLPASGFTGTVSLSYVNKGKNPVSNLEARLTGTNVGAGGYQYLGHLPAGTAGSVDFDLIPDAAGPVSGTITLSYEDAAGEPRTVTKDFTSNVEELTYDDSMMDPGMDMMEPQPTGMPVWGWVLLVVCGGAVIAVVVVVIRRKRSKAKALAALEAEDSDEDL